MGGLQEYMTHVLPPEIAKARDQILKYATDFGLDPYDTIFEMVSYEQINSLAAFGGFPVRYPHWRFGMDYDQLSKGYAWGLQKIYEMVINTDPSYAYLMSSNSLTDQKMVIAHVYGHVDFFKNNYWFSKTNRKMLDTMANHAVKVRDLMDTYGVDKVENFIDQCLSIESLIDPFLPFAQTKRREDDSALTGPNSQTATSGKEAMEVGKIRADRNYMDKYLNPPEFVEQQKKLASESAQKQKKNPAEPQKDVLLYLLENAPLEDWQYECLRIVRDEAYYFAPQGQTKIMNEGWASYWHSRIMTEKALKDSEIIDFACNHSGTMAMSPGRFNPYKIGLEIYRDVEDRWNRGAFGKEYDDCDNLVEKARWNKNLGLGQQKIFEIRKVCNDVTFIDEYLTDELCDRLKLYTYGFNRRTNQHEIVDRDFKKVKEKILFQITNLGQPFIYVTDGNYLNKGELLLWHKFQGMDLDVKWAKETLKSLSEIWKRPVNIETEVEGQKKLLTYNNGEFTEKFL